MRGRYRAYLCCLGIVKLLTLSQDVVSKECPV